MAAPRILVVGNEEALSRALTERLSSGLVSQAHCVTHRDAVENVRENPNLDLLFLELGEGNGKALHTLFQLRALRPNLPIVVLTARGDHDGSVGEAIRAGAHGYLNMPFEDCELDTVVRRHVAAKATALSTAWSSEEAEPLGNGHFFICASPSMRKVRQDARVLADIDGPVLILGEGGTGKDATAQLIHRLSPRSNGHFAKVNCAALAGELLETELFGHESGAAHSRVGKLELCHKGSILLDEVGEMSPSAQAKLLQVLQEGQVHPLGGGGSRQVDVRVLAVANLDLPHFLTERRLREDLYYQLSAFTIVLPPLRERREDIPLLAQHFMDRMAAQYHRSALPLSPALIEACRHYSWPGNLRELENFVKRYLIMGNEEAALRGLGKLSEKHPFAVTEEMPGLNDSDATSLRSLIKNVRGEAEKNAIAAALQKTGWNRKAAARMIKVSYRSLLYKIDEYHLRPSNTQKPPEEHASPGNGNSIKGNGTLG